MSRHDIYYWKCDRPAAFHGTQRNAEPIASIASIEAQLEQALRIHFDTSYVTLRPGPGQGNHLTWLADVGGRAMFIRVENGPEADDHLAVESAVVDRVGGIGVPVPQVYGCDATRLSVPFAWQALEHITAPDLNHWFKQNLLDEPVIATAIGRHVAQWQSLSFSGFGPLDSLLRGYHSTYAAYYHLRLDAHLAFLVARGFLSEPQRSAIQAAIARHSELLELATGCLVHKDLALWNILGTQNQIAAFIDFDDAIAGDPMDDLSLLACFHDGAFVLSAFAGYESVCPLPAEYLRRFWLHLLRNMIVKAVIRVGAGYFDRDSAFFLIPRGASGSTLREFTLARLETALAGLQGECSLDRL